MNRKLNICDYKINLNNPLRSNSSLLVFNVLKYTFAKITVVMQKLSWILQISTLPMLRQLHGCAIACAVTSTFEGQLVPH
jgi:hypothetical protein